MENIESSEKMKTGNYAWQGGCSFGHQVERHIKADGCNPKYLFR